MTPCRWGCKHRWKSLRLWQTRMARKPLLCWAFRAGRRGGGCLSDASNSFCDPQPQLARPAWLKQPAAEFHFTPVAATYLVMHCFHSTSETRRRRRCVRAVAGARRHRGGAGGPVLAGRAGTPGLPGTDPEWLPLPLRAPQLEAASPRPQELIAGSGSSPHPRKCGDPVGPMPPAPPARRLS